MQQSAHATSSSEPIDFNLLRNLTGGDAALEKELLKVFMESADECLNGLRLALAQNDDALWKQHAHAFKGIGLNLGAHNLGQLCRTAQEDYHAIPDDKHAMLRVIEDEMASITSTINMRLT